MPPASIINDEDQVKALVSNLFAALNSGDKNQITKFYASESDERPNSDSEIFNVCSFEIIKIVSGEGNASVTCRIFNCAIQSPNEIEISLERRGLDWHIQPSIALNRLIRATMRGFALRETRSSSSLALKAKTPKPDAIVTPVIDNNMLINIVHPYSSDNTRLLNAQYMANKLNKRLFADDAKIDLDGRYVDLNPDNTIAFHLDPYWNRIIFARKNGEWINSYGDKPSDFKLAGPKAFVADMLDSLFVTDTDHKTIAKFYINPLGNPSTITHVSSISISEIIHPIDIVINQSGSLNSVPANDHIWIADDFSHQLVDIKRDGSVIQRIKTYNVAGTSYTLNNPVKVQTQEIGGRLAFIDGDRNSFVVLTPPSTYAYFSVEFDKATSQLSCIGQDANNEWWVGDQKMRVYHKFTSDGKYIASYSASNTPNGQFSSPVTISKAPYYKNGGTIYRSQYVYTSDLWGTNTGERAFFPGADALNRSFSQYTNDFCKSGINFLLTNQAYAKGTLYLNDGVTELATYDFGALQAGNQTVYVDRFLMGDDNYMFKLELKPFFWTSYGLLGPGWSEYWVPCYASHVPTFAAGIFPITRDQTCFYQTGYWEVIPPCPTGLYSYHWYYNLSTGSQEWYSFGSNSPQASRVVPVAVDFELKCDVKNEVPGGYTWTAYYRNCPPPPPPPPSCPYVFTWDGNQFQEDNNILPQSEYPANIGQDVTDYYRLLKPLMPSNGRYVLQIREFENERSYLDYFELIAVDHPVGTKIDVSQMGEIFQYVNPRILSRATLKGNDLLVRLSSIDTLSVLINSEDTLDLSWNDIFPSKSAHVPNTVEGGVESAASSPPKDQKTAYIRQPEVVNSDTPSFAFRQRPTLVFSPVAFDSSGSVKLIWREKALLDYVNFGVLLRNPTYHARTLPLSWAAHSIDGMVTTKLFSEDSVYQTLIPGQFIELRFRALPPPAPGVKRTFILVSRGRYEKLQNSSFALPSQLPVQEKLTEYVLSSNYPNPFNPTTVIHFELPSEGHAYLLVYDILGRETARLVDEFKAAGKYDVTFDASSLPSGLYFYKLVAGNYQSMKKMLIVK